MGARESSLASFLPTRVSILGPGDELDGGAIIPGFRVGLATLFEDVDDDLGATD